NRPAPPPPWCPPPPTRPPPAEPMKPEPPVTSVRMPRSPFLRGPVRAVILEQGLSCRRPMDRSGSVGQVRGGGRAGRGGARPMRVGTRVVPATRGWLLPYLLIAVVSVCELLLPVRVI